MSGTAIGAVKGTETIIQRHGVDFFKRIGSLGGKAGHTGGFYRNPQAARAAGLKGGRKPGAVQSMETKRKTAATYKRKTESYWQELEQQYPGITTTELT